MRLQNCRHEKFMYSMWVARCTSQSTNKMERKNDKSIRRHPHLPTYYSVELLFATLYIIQYPTYNISYNILQYPTEIGVFPKKC